MRSKLCSGMLAVLLCAALLASLAGLVGCGQQGKPKVMVFLGKSSKSYAAMKPVVDKLQKKFGDKVIWINVDYDNKANKGQLDKYSVSMNPTVIIFNTAGQIKETYMGAAQEDMLSSAIQSFIPGASKAPTSQPGTVTTPGAPVPVPGTQQQSTTPSGP